MFHGREKIKLILFISRTTADVQTTNMKNDIRKARGLNTDDVHCQLVNSRWTP
jgi:hypothetical protein